MACLSNYRSCVQHRTLSTALVMVVSSVGLIVPARVWDKLPDLCLFHRFMGVPCPTCGLTRSWSALLHGHLEAAFRFHLLGPPLFLGIVIWTAMRFRNTEYKWSRPSVILGAGLIWTSYSIARMAGWLPSPPGT